MSNENGISMQEWFQQLIGEDGYSEKGGRILAGDIEWSEIPDNEEVRAWLRAVIQNPEDKNLPWIEGMITAKEIQHAFGKARENTSSSLSGIDYTIWKSVAKDEELAITF